MAPRTALLCALGLALGSAAQATAPPVKVTLRTSWPAPQLIPEILETAAIEDERSFFPLLDHLTSPSVATLRKTSTARDIYDFGATVVQQHLRGFDAYESFTANLALHAASPKLEAYNQFYTRFAERHAVVLEQTSSCGSWVDWYGETVCNVSDLKSFVENAHNASITPQQLHFLSFDHRIPHTASNGTSTLRTAILYADIDSPNFRPLHEYLLSHSSSEEPTLQYILRYVPAPSSSSATRRSTLSGYGVLLDLKKTDYLALDDRNKILKNDQEQGTEDETTSDPSIDLLTQRLAKYPENDASRNTSSPLSPDELINIGLQVVQLVHDSDDGSKLKVLQQISQNFPKYSSQIARRVNFSEKISEEVSNNNALVQAGANKIWLNGVPIAEANINPYGLLRLMRKERKVVESLTSLDMEPGQAIDFLTHKAFSASQSESSISFDNMYDASDRIEGEKIVVYWNNIEKDKRYSRWSPSLFTIMRPLYPGQFHHLRRNIFNIILALDLSKMENLNIIGSMISNIIGRGFPFRFGLVPLVESKDAEDMAQLFYYMIETVGRGKTMQFIKNIVGTADDGNGGLTRETVDWAVIRAELKSFADELDAADAPAANLALDLILKGSETTPVRDLDPLKAYVKRLDLRLSTSPAGHAFVNGKHFHYDDAFLRNMQMEVAQHLQYIQETIYKGILTDDNADSVATFFYDLPSSSARRNQHIYPTSTKQLNVKGLTDLFENAAEELERGKFLYATEPTLAVSESEWGVFHVLNDDNNTHVPISAHLIGDLDAPGAQDFISKVLTALNIDKRVRLSFLHNPHGPAGDISDPLHKTSTRIAQLQSWGYLQMLDISEFASELGLSPLPTAVEPTAASTLANRSNVVEIPPIEDFLQETYDTFTNLGKKIGREIDVSPSSFGLLINGRVVGPLESDSLDTDDILAVFEYEYEKRAKPTVAALSDLGLLSNKTDRYEYASLVSIASSVAAASQLPDPSESGLMDIPIRARAKQYSLLQGSEVSASFGNKTAASYHFGVLLDPLSDDAPRWSSLLQWLVMRRSVHVDLILHPIQSAEMPLKKFYRFNLQPSLRFDEFGNEVDSHAEFFGLPIEPIYTLAMDVPQSWLVRPRESKYDLDNIQLGALASEDQRQGLKANFDLDYLVIEGHARATHNAPPRGLQLQLTDWNATSIDDTLVVASLGYLQLKASPGVYNLDIREGRGRDVFAMESAGSLGWDSPTVRETGNEIDVSSFDSITIYPRFSRLPGMETADVLEPSLKPQESQTTFSSVLSNIGSLFGGTPSNALATSGPAGAEINIFTVASGLLYERFASIMILSVLRNTKKTVKFWFIENFLSPSFLEFIPHFAKQYNFEYELVTYKWPSWLRAQKEKQRIIWAYKILFLDVLFPMSLKKVIFVDADQIVRTDLKELVDVDLHGAPYGYTPMGEDNYEMEGFRFWKTGYWRDFLRGQPYHISALYVVDLVRFREIAAGDILRQHYHQLSADPNSLANLDQDLPNNLQREIPIFSLNEDWLWCETWCSKDRLHRAKTIDLCQNPLTKEPKLSRARQIPEWELYDNEVSAFARQLAEQGRIGTAAAVDTQVLAGDAPKAKENAPPPMVVSDPLSPSEVWSEPIRDEL